MRYYILAVSLLIIFFAVMIITVWGSSNVIRSNYPVKTLPGRSRTVFSPGIISTGLNERDFSMSPDGSEIFFSIMWRGYSVICHVTKANGSWSAPETAPFSGNTLYYDAEPCFSPDGKSVYFLSTRPLPGDEYKKGWGYEHIWHASKNGKAWSEPVPADMPVEKDKNYFFPSFTSKGDMYLTVSDKASGESRICKAELKEGRFLEAVALPENVNAVKNQYNGWVDPEERFLLFCAAGREDNVNNADIFVSFNDAYRGWSKPLNAGNEINLAGSTAQSVSLTPDGRYIVFSASYLDMSPESGRLSYADLYRLHNSHANGSSDLYWIETSVLEELRPNAEW